MWGKVSNLAMEEDHVPLAVVAGRGAWVSACLSSRGTEEDIN